MRKSLEELQQAVKMDDIYHFKLRDSKTTEEKPKKERNVPPAPLNMKMISLKERGLCSELCKRASWHQAQLFECQLQRGRSDIEYFFHCYFLERTVHIDKGCSQSPELTDTIYACNNEWIRVTGSWIWWIRD